MQKLTVSFKNCYGIREMDAEFDFNNKPAQLIYAPNGAMKSSFAKTFKDHSASQDSRDRIYTTRTTQRSIVDETGTTLSPARIFVIEPYDAGYQSGKVSTLLVNKALKEEYDSILSAIQSKQDALISRLQKTAGMRSGLEELLSLSFSRKSDNLLKSLERVKTEVLEDSIDASLSGINYSTIFNDKTEKFLEEDDIKEALSDYTRKYDDLLGKSRFFRKGIFNHYQASEIAKQLKNHGFFQADHKVYLYSGGGDTKVENEKQLESLISEELDTILSDADLKKQFDKIDKKMSNKELRDFREFLLGNQSIIPRLSDVGLLREELLKSYLMAHRDEFRELMVEYAKGKMRLDEIAKEATDQATKWQEVLNIFNRRFSVPFKVNIENKQDVILKRSTPNIGFMFEDNSAQSVPVGRDQLVDVLSNGERRALYILNIIFEVEARKADKVNTLFIVDDIADSFDYKNKYAIIEYLNDIQSDPNFRQIILTHNYDFYRTVWKRLDLNGAVFHVSKTSTKIELSSEKMYRDPFEKWKKFANTDDKTDALLALVPFVRNLAEYCGYDAESLKLTSLLHRKADSETITLEQLLAIYGKLLNGHSFLTNIDKASAVLPLLLQTATQIASGGDVSLDLEKKVVLSIAIRLRAEKKMIEVIDDNAFVEAITKNQTAKLLTRFKEKLAGDASKAQLVALMERVNLMTPENIHLNSFMYEPILDMSAEHLARLHGELVELENA
jgi:ABC-type Mn2+/Zn2+ transport system ATPase subunit